MAARRIGIVTSPAEKLSDYFPTAAEPEVFPVEPPFTPDDQLAVDELRRAGLAVEPVVWGFPVDLLRRHYDLVIVRSPWDYMDTPELRERFVAWLGELREAGVPTENPPGLMLWLIDKRYLLDLEAAGAAIVPTEVVGKGSRVCLAERFDRHGPLVVKPALSAAGVGLEFLASRREACSFQSVFDVLCGREAYLVQPFVPEIRSAGEWSLVYLGGEYSHALHKRPAPGTILCHAERGGSLAFTSPPRCVIDLADRVIAAVPSASAGSELSRRLPDTRGGPDQLPPLYLRIDILETGDGPRVSECEGVEPELFFRARPGSERRFRELVLGRLERLPVRG
jgi:glutathione synthase/RimK-type ligase-like ATP-grasp enzyme